MGWRRGMNPERLHVMFGIGDLADHYNQHVGVAITSLAMNCSLPVTVHLLYDENLHKGSLEYLDNQEKYHQLEKQFGIEIFYHHIVLPEYVLNSHGWCGWFSSGWPSFTFLRLFALDILVNLDWILYLDGDIIVNMDFAELWTQSSTITNYAIAGCLDHGPKYWKKSQWRYYRKTGVPVENYINAGVLFMNLKKIREQYDLVGKTKSILEKHPDLPLLDQDILNMIFVGDIHILPEKYNLPAGLYHGEEYKTSCIHYIFREKPWRDIDYPAAEEYWKYLFLSPWGDTIEKYILSIQLLIRRSLLDEHILTGSIWSPRKVVVNLVRRGWREIRGVKNVR